MQVEQALYFITAPPNCSPLPRHKWPSTPLKRPSPPPKRPRPTAKAQPPLPLSTALSEIANFTGTRHESRLLSKRLLNTLITMPTATDANLSDDTSTALYQALKSASFLRAFSAARPPPGSTPSQKRISASRLAAQAGLPLSALSPRRGTVLAWQVAGIASVAAVVQLTRLLGVEQLARPALLAIGALFAADQIVLRGALFEGVYRALFPRYEEKVVKHEAGHFLAAYLHGLAVRGYVLSAAEAVRAGIPGQAGCLFADAELFTELKSGRLSTRVIDRYSIVSMAGIAAEAIHYGEAEGGESDVAALLQLLTTLQPPWTEQSVRSQARWAVLEAILLLRKNQRAFGALCDAMRERKSLGDCILCIEDHVELVEKGEEGKVDETALAEKELAILVELERIQRKVKHLDEQ